MTNRVIVIDDDEAYCRIIKLAFKDAFPKFSVDTTTNEIEMYRMMQEAKEEGNPYAIASIDMDFRIQNSTDTDLQEPLGRQILSYVKKNYPETVCIMISGAPVTSTEALMLRDTHGLDFFIRKGGRFDPTIFKMCVEHTLEHRSSIKLDGNDVQDSVAGKQVFISYKRSSTWGKARAIANSLEKHGVDVFLDVDSIGSGEFPVHIITSIVQREYFISLLTLDTLQSEWVQREIEYAMQAKRKIIPVLLDGFEMNNTTIPSKFSNFLTLNALKITPETYKGDIDRLINQFLR